MNIPRHIKFAAAALLTCIGSAATFSAQAAFTITDVTVTEGETAVLTILRDGGRRRAEVSWATVDDSSGGAEAGVDYDSRSGRVRVRRGGSVQISVPTINDNVGESDETFNVVLSNPEGDSITDGTGVVTILDDDNGPPPPSAAQCNDTLDNDGDGLVDFPADPGCSSPNDNDEFNAPPPAFNTSINSTSRNGTPGEPVPEQPFSTSDSFNIFASNDLGMHCGDLDTRISSILPPFNAVHSQVIQRGTRPVILSREDGVEVIYSAASNPGDPILSGQNSAGTGPVASSALLDGSVYKTNFWSIALDAYPAFYPPGLLAGVYPAGDDIVDLGLPMPNLERFYLGDGVLDVDQQELAGYDFGQDGTNGSYVLNDPLPFKVFTVDQAFFTGLPFGYAKDGVNWFEAAGIPLTAYDDFGRENPWPLMRVQARAGGQVIASLDTVLPISGEANCGECHNAKGDGTDNGIATENLVDVALSIEDPAFDNNGPHTVPMDVALEWAADINILRLHDQKHDTALESAIDPDTGRSANPVVCQRCHYSPALDLAQLGPLGPEFDPNGLANGRDQIKHKSMSNVMHSHHGGVTDGDGNKLFPEMPPSVDADGNLRDPDAARDILMQTCYQCHPGRRTDCLRGAMANGDMLCQDCHGNMEQVGDDFTHNVSLPDNVGNFDLGDDFYTNPATPRVPWANEPGCGSCHTGDFNDNLAGTNGTVVNPTDSNGNTDGIRLRVAYNTINNPKAAPIVPINKRFAENVVDADPNPNDEFDPRGNPMLYRVSTGHGDVFCEGCHGATHGIWPNKNPDANDNVAANQLQGHAGAIIECSTCHGTAMNGQNTLNGPHGMHPVGNDTTVNSGSAAGPRISFVDGGHENLAEGDLGRCQACHGPGNRGSMQGTVLSVAKKDRRLNGQTIPEGTPIACTICHDGGGDD